MRKKKKKINFEILENIRIEEMVAEGKCLARHENMVIFVGGVAPGDVVDLPNAVKAHRDLMRDTR